MAAILPRFAYEDFKGDDIKVLLQSKQTITTTLPLSAESSHFVVKGYQIGQRRSPFHKSLLSTPSPHFVLRTFGNSFQDWLNHLPRDQSKADQFPWSSLLPLLKTGATFVIFQFSRSSPNHHHLSKMIESGLAMTPTSSLTTHGCITSGLVDLCMPHLFKCSLASSSSTESNSSLLHIFPMVWGLQFLKTNLSSKDWGEEGTKHLSLFHVLCYQVSCSIQLWSHIFPPLPSAVGIPI